MSSPSASSGARLAWREMRKGLDPKKLVFVGETWASTNMTPLARSQAFHGVRFDGKTYDCGAKLGFLAANVAFALADPELAPLLKTDLRKILGTP